MIMHVYPEILFLHGKANYFIAMSAGKSYPAQLMSMIAAGLSLTVFRSGMMRPMLLIRSVIFREILDFSSIPKDWTTYRKRANMQRCSAAFSTRRLPRDSETR